MNAVVVQIEEQPLFQMEDGGAVPTSPLKTYKVEMTSIQGIRKFIERWHYSGNVNGVIPDICFKLTSSGQLLGGAIFGRLAMVGQWKKYVNKESDILELRRFCCIDNAPKNTESYFLSKCLLLLKKYAKVKVIISYADLDYGHQGVIYKATNFRLVGKTPKGKVIYFNNQKFHDKTILTKYKGKLKPFAQRIKNALLTGEAYYKNTLGKNIFLYYFVS